MPRSGTPDEDGHRQSNSRNLFLLHTRDSCKVWPRRCSQCSAVSVAVEDVEGRGAGEGRKESCVGLEDVPERVGKEVEEQGSHSGEWAEEVRSSVDEVRSVWGFVRAAPWVGPPGDVRSPRSLDLKPS